MTVLRPGSMQSLAANQVVTMPQERPDGPLVPELYNRLRTYFGDVSIANPGEEMLGVWAYDATYQRHRYQVMHYGETYKVDCMFCNDTRKRLWIPYAYGMKDPANDRFYQTFYGRCYNEECLDNPTNRKRLADLLVGFVNADQRQQMLVRQGIQVPTTVGPKNPPGVCIPLSQLADTHLARQYVSSRGFYQPTWEQFQLSVCVQVSDEYAAYSRILSGRLVIPVVFDGMCIGWQARALGDVPKGVPKYFTCPQMPRRLCLYNYDIARKFSNFVVVFEGPTDCWRLPWASVALLGKAMTPRQRQLLQETWLGRPIVLVLDPDAEEEMRDQLLLLRQTQTNPVCAVRLPDNVDPADLEEAVLFREICRQAAAQGIQLAV